MNRKKIIISLTVYSLLVLALLFYFNSKRSEELIYNYDLNSFSLDAGEVTKEGFLSVGESSGYSGVFATSPLGQYRAANFVIAIKYSSDSNQTMHVYANSNLDEYITLLGGQTDSVNEFTVWPSSDMVTIKFEYSGSGDFTVKSIAVTSDKPLYTDYEYYMILTAILGLLFPFLALLLTKKCGYGKKEWITFGVLGIAGVLVNYPLIINNFLWGGTDMRPHLMRTDGVAKAFEARFFPTIIYSNYCNDHGELSCMYPDKFLYFIGFLRYRGVSLLAAYFTAHVLISIATLAVMYFSTRLITKSREASVIAAILYCFIPYRIYVMYGGGQAFGNGLAMIFFPLVFAAFYDIFFREGRKWYLLSIGMAGIMCSHILSTMLCAIICVVEFICCELLLLIRKDSRQRQVFLNLGKAVLTFLILCLSTLVPFLYYYMQGLSTDNMLLRFADSLWSTADNFLTENGIFHLMLLAICVFCVIYFFRKKIRIEFYCVLMLAIGFGLFWMSTNLFPWGLFLKNAFIEKCLNMFQFSERFMLGGNAALCIGIAMLAKPFAEDGVLNGRVKKSARICAIALLLIFTFIGCKKINFDIDFRGVFMTDRMTGNIYHRQLGYLPKGTDISYYDSATPGCGDWESVENISYIKNGTSVHYEYKCSKDGNYIEFPLFNYDGYHAYDGNGNEIEIINSERNKIQINLIKSEEPQAIDVVFMVKGLFKACALVSFVATISLYAYVIWGCKKCKIKGLNEQGDN